MNSTIEKHIETQKETRSEKEKIRNISRTVRSREKELREKYSILKYQDQIGLSIFSASALAMLLVSYFYIAGFLGAIPAIILNAIFASFLHELEHDLIHGMYYKERGLEKFMMYGVWLFRGNTPNPYYRKKIHLLHHRESGQVRDVEEQLIGNGMQHGWKRLLVTLDSSFGFVFQRKKLKTQAPEFKELESFMASFPFMFLFGFLMYTCLSLNILNLSLSYFSIQTPSFLSNVVNILNIIAVVYILPNVLRQTCLQFISSNIHYFGDIREGRDGTLEQTQVLNSPLFILPHLFCFNFGSTHGIHHIVVNQPFYIRQMVASEAHRAMKEEGMRFNDFGTFLRANRYHKESYKAA